MHAYSTPEGIAQDNLQAESTKQPALKKAEAAKGITILDSARRDLEATLQLLADRAQYITGAAGAAIALRDGDRVLCRASTGSAAPELGAVLDLRSGLSGESVRTRMALRCDDVATDSRVDRESCRRLGIASFAVMPILRNDEVIGIFEIFAGKPRSFQERDLAAMERLREMVNVALDEASPQRAKQSSFAVHGKMKAMSAAAGASVGSASTRLQEAGELGFVAELPGSSILRGEGAKASERIQTCQRCDFPVSEGRALCLDCEDKGMPSAEPGLSIVGNGRTRSGFKAWIISNRYVIGMVLISAATIAFALLR